MDYFSNDSYSEEERRNSAFQVLCAIRESITIGRKYPNAIRYEDAFDILFDLAPDLYNSFNQLLAAKNDSEIVKFYLQKAEVMSSEDVKVLPIDLIDKELAEMQALLDIDDGKEKRQIRNRLIALVGAKKYFSPRKVSEHKILEHDFFLARRDEEIFGKELYQDCFRKDYKLPNNNVFRLRLAHPDRVEQVLGVDLIYEYVDIINDRVRFMHLQYKAWDEKKFYFSSSRNLWSQIEKLSENFCDQGFCNGPTGTYRFPHCSTFLRPTSNKINEASKLRTTGIHIPVCKIRPLLKAGSSLTKDNTNEISITHNIFEELFNSNFVGSRWLSISELEDFYEEKKLLELTDTIRVHVQEVPLKTEES